MPEITRVSRSESWRRDFIVKHRGRCHYCNRGGLQDLGPDERPWHVDHMHALARGGEDTEDNLTLACKRCNLAKGVQPYARFRAFAKAALWVPDDWRVSEFELDRFMDNYARVQNRWEEAVGAESKWRVDGEERIVVIGVDGVTHPEVVVRLGAPDDNNMDTAHPKANLLDFIVSMYTHLPAAITELRMLRAEVEELRAAQKTASMALEEAA